MKRALAAALASSALLGAPQAFAAPGEPASAKPAPIDPARAPVGDAIPPTAASIRKAVVAPTLIGVPGSYHRPTERDGELRTAASAVDAQIADAAQDLGLSIDVGRAATQDLSRATEAELLSAGRDAAAVLVLPSLHAEGGAVVVRVALVDPTSKVIHVRTARATNDDASVHAAVLLRDLVGDLRGKPPNARDAAGAPGRAAAAPPPVSSNGRAILMVNATLLGGLVGFSVQKASGSSDPRLLYPLLAVGAGIGLGSSLLITEEWDVTAADAWYLSAGMWWPTLAGHFIYAGRFNTLPEADRWEFGLIGAASGVTISTLALTLHPMSDGGAWLAHSGGGLGVVFGGLSEFMAKGSIHATPFAGMGYGAGVGWLAAAAAATQLKTSPTRVLAIDIGALVGGLGGAALGSPLVFGKRDAGKQRGWVGITGGLALAGGAVGYVFGRERAPAPKNAWLVPEPSVLGESVVGDRRAPIVGLGWRAALEADGTPRNVVR